MKQLRRHFRRRRRVEGDANTGPEARHGGKFLPGMDKMQPSVLQFRSNESRRCGESTVPMQQGEDSAPSSVGNEVVKSAGGGFAEIHRKAGHDQQVMVFGDTSSPGVVFHQIGEFISQIHLENLLQMLGQFGQPFLNFGRLRPYSLAGSAFGLRIVSQMH